MPGYVLDSFALIAYFRDETGADKVEALLHKAANEREPLHMTERIMPKRSTSLFVEMVYRDGRQ